MNQSEVSAMDLGPQQFKNVVREIRVYRVLDGKNGISQVGHPRQKKRGSAKYRYLLAGLGAGVLVTAVLLMVILISARKSGFQSYPNTTHVPAEFDQPAPSRMAARPSGDHMNLNPQDQPRFNQSLYPTDDMQIIDEQELIQLRTGLAFLEWAVRAEE